MKTKVTCFLFIIIIVFVYSQKPKPEMWGKPMIFVEKKPEPPKKVYLNREIPISKICDSLGISKNQISFEVYKKERVFNLLYNKQIIKSYPIVLGFNPIGDKQQEGDGKTPEGTFKIRSKRIHDSWTRFIWIDYPNAESKRKFQYNKINGLIPQNATIGGEVGIHGVPYKNDYIIKKGLDWTMGCVSLSTEDIKDLYSVISTESEVTIYP